MYTYHPDSWSQQARKMADDEVWCINNGWQTIEGATRFFSTSYRHPLIRGRAAKRFGRLLRAGKVHEHLDEYRKHFSLEGNDEDA